MKLTAWAALFPLHLGLVISLATACAEPGKGGIRGHDDEEDGGSGGAGGGGGAGGEGGATGCTGTLKICGGVCMDTSSVPEHCGDCDIHCNPNEICVDSHCINPANCGNSTLEPGEEVDPPNSTFTTLNVNVQTCRWDLSQVKQLYCNGTCSWGGVDDCDQSDADVYCKLVNDDPSSVATSFEIVPVLDQPGFACPLSAPKTLGVLGSRGFNGPVAYQDAALPTTHGTTGEVVTNVVCSDP